MCEIVFSLFVLVVFFLQTCAVFQNKSTGGKKTAISGVQNKKQRSGAIFHHVSRHFCKGSCT